MPSFNAISRWSAPEIVLSSKNLNSSSKMARLASHFYTKKQQQGSSLACLGMGTIFLVNDEKQLHFDFKSVRVCQWRASEASETLSGLFNLELR